MKNTLACLFAFTTTMLLAQVDFSKRYASGKELFQNGKYNLAMETFKPLMVYDQNNSFVEYASFYHAVSAYHQGYKSVAKDGFNQIKKLYPNWDKINEVNFWLARIYFDNRDYFQGLKVLHAIEDKKFEADIESLKKHHIATVTDVETLKMMHEEYPKDEIVAHTLAHALSKNLSDPEDRKTLDELIHKFNLKKGELIPEAPKTIHKERYAVSVLLPFAVSSLEPTPGRKRNQIILDFYEGMKMAADTLATQNVNISVRAYDTERNNEKVRRLLETEEIKNTDLIVGPLFPEENKLVQEFAMANQINVFHPFSNNTDITGENPFGFLFQPSSEVIGKKSAQFVADHTRGKKQTMIFYGPGKKDSVLAANFEAEARLRGLRVLRSEKINNNKETKRISDILSTPTEYDEFKYPSQFTLAKDSLQSVFVASDDPLIYTKVVGAVEMRGDSVLVVGTENWLDDNAIDLDKYQSLGIVMTAPNFWQPKKAEFRSFQQKFLREHSRLPGNVARMGFEFMLFIGNQLKTNGVYFQDAIRQNVLPGYLGEGFDYRFSRDNQVVPFATIKKGEYTLIEKR
jgi:hypothetical protein